MEGCLEVEGAVGGGGWGRRCVVMGWLRGVGGVGEGTLCRFCFVPGGLLGPW